MKKIISFLTIMCFGLFASCDLLKPHEHEYATVYSGDKVNHYYECSCGEKKDVEAHTGGDDATCIKKSVCSVCGLEYGDYAAHTFTVYVKNNNASCTQNETETSICDFEGCNAVDERDIPDTKLPHNPTLNFDEFKHYYECDCGYITGEESHSGGEATTTEKAICEICNQPYGDLKNDPYNPGIHNPDNCHSYEIYIYKDKKFADENFYTRVLGYGVGEEYEVFAGYIGYYDNLWGVINVNVPVEVPDFAIYYYDYTMYQLGSVTLLNDSSKVLYLVGDSYYNSLSEAYDSIRCELPPVGFIEVQINGAEVILSWLNEEYFDMFNVVGYQLVVSKNGDEIICEQINNHHRLDISSFEPGDYDIYITVLGDNITSMDSIPSHTTLPVVGGMVEDFYLSNINYEVASLNNYGFDVKVSWETPVNVDYYTARLSIPFVGYNNEIYNDTFTYVSFGTPITELDGIYEAYLSYEGYLNGNYVFFDTSVQISLSYKQEELPTIDNALINVDAKQASLTISFDNLSGSNYIYEYYISSYIEEPSYGYYFENGLMISLYGLQERLEPYYLYLRVVDNDAMMNVSNWTMYEFVYYVERVRLEAPSSISYEFDRKEQKLTITFDTKPYEEYEYVDFEYEINGVKEYVTFDRNYEFFGIEIPTENFPTGMYNVSIKAIGNDMNYTSDSEIVYINNIFIEERPIAQRLPYVENIKVEMICCTNGVPSVLAFRVSWDEVVTDLPIEKVQLILDNPAGGGDAVLEVTNGEIIERAYSYTHSGGVSGVNIQGRYDCSIRLVGDDYLSLTNDTPFSFFALYDSSNELESIATLSELNISNENNMLSLNWNEEVKDNEVIKKYYVSIKNSEGKTVLKQLISSSKEMVDVSSLEKGEYTVSLQALGDYTYQNEVLNGVKPSNIITSNITIY